MKTSLSLLTVRVKVGYSGGLETILLPSIHDTPRPSEPSHMLLNERMELVGKGGKSYMGLKLCAFPLGMLLQDVRPS